MGLHMKDLPWKGNGGKIGSSMFFMVFMILFNLEPMYLTLKLTTESFYINFRRGIVVVLEHMNVF